GDRKEAEEQLAEALAKVAPIRVTVHAPAGGPAEVTVVAQHVARTSSDLRPELLFPVTLSAQLATVELELDPGAWTLRVEGPGYERQEQRVELAQGAASAVEFTLAAVPASAAAGPGLGPIDAPPPVRGDGGGDEERDRGAVAARGATRPHLCQLGAGLPVRRG